MRTGEVGWRPAADRSMPTFDPNGVITLDSFVFAPTRLRPGEASALTVVPAGKAPGGTRTPTDESWENTCGIVSDKPEPVTVPDDSEERSTTVNTAMLLRAAPLDA